MPSTPHKPDADTLAKIERLLQRLLDERGESAQNLTPQEIMQYMHCAVYPDGGLSYSWRGEPLLDVHPEQTPTGVVHWVFFSYDTPPQ